MEIVEMKIHFRTGMTHNVVPIASDRIVRFPDRGGRLRTLAATIKEREKKEAERRRVPYRGALSTLRERFADARTRYLKASLERKTEACLRRALKNSAEVEVFDRNEGVYGAFRSIRVAERDDIASILDSDRRFFDEDYLSLFPLYMGNGAAIALA